ncbi:MAG: ABC transporter permease subunit [Candidatus Limnocylindrales bacterium]
MSTSVGPIPSSSVLTTTSPWSRVYGLGSVYAKTLRDSRLAILIVGGLLGALLLSSGVGFGEAYATLESRADLAKLVASLPPALTGVYGNPFPTMIETLGGSIAWKTAASLGLVAAIWSILALSSTLAAESRRGSMELVAVTPLGLRRIAVEKLFAHLTGMLIVMVIVAVTAWMAGALFGTLPGDEIPPVNAIGFALWVGLVALASGAVAFALAPFVGRGAAAGIAGAVLIGGYFLNGYQATVPAFAGLANLTWFGWTVHHQPLIGEPDWLSLGLVALVTIVLFAIGIEAFSRRDLGSTSRIPWPAFPEATLGLRGPTSRSFGERLPLALAWGIGVGVFAFVIGAAARSFGDEIATMSPSTLDLFKSIFPNIDLTSGAGAFLQLVFVEFGFILAGFAAATIVAGWASDETSGRLEELLATPMSRARWAVAGGLGVFAAIVVFAALLAAGVGLGVAIGGGDVVTPVVGTVVLGLYALALAGIGLAVGGLLRTSLAGEVVAAIVILTFVVGLVAPALKLPDWVNQLALTAHLGQPMVGTWDWAGMIACVVLALGGLALAGWGMSRRDVAV